MKQCTFILALLLLMSCARKFSYSDAFRNGIPADMHQWPLDSSYQLYIREVNLETGNRGNYQVKTYRDNDIVPDKLIEVEYLLFSAARQKAVYIATIPDKYQVYYAQKIRYLKRTEINAYDCSTFRFGKIAAAASTIVFEWPGTGDSDTWRYVTENDSLLRVKQVEKRKGSDINNIFLVDEAINPGAVFVRLDSFTIAYRDMGKEKRNERRMGRSPLLRYCKDRTIYYRHRNNRYTLYFRFDRNLAGRKETAISFGNNRLVTPPF